MLYDLQSKQSSKHSFRKNGKGQSLIHVSKRVLFGLGGGPPSIQVQEWDLSTLKATSLPSIRIPRCGAGLAKVGQYVYVFGGWNETDQFLKSCEKYKLQENQSLPLGNMREHRCSFTPCSFRALIYLTSTHTTRKIETFSPEMEAFTLFSPELPPEMIGFPSVSFISNEELFIFSGKKQLGRLMIESERWLRLSHTFTKCRSSQPPLIVGSIVLIALPKSGEVQSGVVHFPLDSNYAIFPAKLLQIA